MIVIPNKEQRADLKKRARAWREEKYKKEPEDWGTKALKRLFKDELQNIKDRIKRRVL